MKTLEETFDIINNLNEDAHNDAFDTWIKADSLSDSDNEEDWDEAEALREEASIEQSSYFRGYFYDLDETDQDSIRYWIQNGIRTSCIEIIGGITIVWRKTLKCITIHRIYA